MQVTHQQCAGIDVHKKTVVVCCLSVDANGQPQREMRTYGTTTRDLLSLCDWLSSAAITHVAMESTGEYWKPVYNLLEGSFEVMVVDSHHFKQVPGRKTDVKDAEWLAELLSYGLVRGSFIPPLPQRDLRDLTRQRTTLIRERASVINRLQKVLEWANLKLASVVTDISGVSARAMLKALVTGTEDPEILAGLALMSDANQASTISSGSVGASTRPSLLFDPNPSGASGVSRALTSSRLTNGLSS